MGTRLNIKGSKVILEGNEISGETYPIKDWIKKYLDGKWDAERRCWVVNRQYVEAFLKSGVISVDDTPVPVKTVTRWNGWCNRCGSYCWGDCTASDR